MPLNRFLLYMYMCIHMCMKFCLFYQILALYDAFDSISVDSVVHYVSSLQQSDGCFYGDKWGEVDTRFSFCAVACLSLLVSSY